MVERAFRARPDNEAGAYATAVASAVTSAAAECGAVVPGRERVLMGVVISVMIANSPQEWFEIGARELADRASKTGPAN